MKEDKYSQFKEDYWHCSSYWICPENCSGVSLEKWKEFVCSHYVMVEKDNVPKTKQIKLKSEPITYFEHMMRKKINDRKRV